jgi:hypothetical protein
VLAAVVSMAMLLLGLLVIAVIRAARLMAATPTAAPSIAPERLFIVRAAADEAAGLLTTAAFLSLCVGYCWTPVGRLVDWTTSIFFHIPDDETQPMRLRRLSAKAMNALVVALPPVLVLSLVLAFSSTELPRLTAFATRFIRTPALIAALETASSYTQVFLHLFSWWVVLPLITLASIPLLATAAFLVALAPFALAAGSLSVFVGPEIALASLTHEFTIEACPPGTWTIHQVSGRAERSRLAHSSYADIEVLKAVSDWIVARERCSRHIRPVSLPLEG